MRRWDHAPFFSMQQPLFTVPFYVLNDYSAFANTTNLVKWEPNRAKNNFLVIILL
jgi:hypothetical protein